MTKAFFAAGHALAAVISASACLSFAAVAADAPRIDLPRRPKDGYGDVSRANAFGAEGKWDAGRKFIAELRARPAEGRTLEERQSVDMAEFALLRHNFETNRTRCVECLKTVYDAGCTSFWGWAAYSFLKEHGEDVPEPPKDPLRGLGAWGDGVVNLEPKKLVTGNGELGTGNGEWVTGKVPSIACLGNIKPADLKPGSPVRRAILRKRLVEICTEEKINEVLGAEGGAALFARLWEDDATLEDFLLSGPVFDAPLALETLMTLFLNDETEKWSRTELGRRAAVAVALNARNGDDMKATVRHWAAFRRIGMWGRFVPEAAKRDCREWRFIVRYPVDSADILYLNAAKDFPKRKIGNLGLRDIPYRKRNCFGVRKWAKGGVYYTPWLASGLPRYYLFTRVGGICEEQSSWAALFANAHGIMSVPAFQPERKATRFQPKGPAHLCWLMRQENGEWRICNNIRPYTGSRFTLWGKGFQYVQSAERAFADRTAFEESELLMFGGRFKEAAMRCPCNLTAWRAYTESLKASNASSRDWKQYLKDLVKLAPEGRQATWDFAHEAMDAMAAKGMKKTPLAKEASRLFAGLPQPKSRIAEEMDFAKFALDRELARFRRFPKLHDEVLAAALAANKDSANYLPQIFAYAIKRFGKDKARLA
ncbi:MAG: hypothetical protein K6F50_05990, partial [Kiritimatiellae bacterium]|nr:hypothetical protein [Kiritimatiellia bacterium]